MPAFLAHLGKKLLVDLVLDPEQVMKYFLWLLMLLLLIVSLIVMPFLMLSTTPFVLLGSDVSDSNPNVNAVNNRYVNWYKAAPVKLEKATQAWVAAKRAELAYCDDLVESYDFNVDWYDLLAIDAARYSQNFKKANQSTIYALAEKFIVKQSYVTQYYVTRTDSKGKKYTVTKYRGHIIVKSKTFEQIVQEIGITAQQREWAISMKKNVQMYELGLGSNIFDQVDMSNLPEYPAGNAKIPYYNQGDRRWAAHAYGESTVMDGGCGPTSLAMVVTGLSGRVVTPDMMADWSFSHGHRAEGSGSYWSLMTAGGKAFGLSVKPVSRLNPKAILDALSNGKPVIAAMGRGHFTRNGHFIVLRGLDSNGRVIVNDPASASRSQQTWDIKTIISESSKSGGIGGSPFWIFNN